MQKINILILLWNNSFNNILLNSSSFRYRARCSRANSSSSLDCNDSPSNFGFYAFVLDLDSLGLNVFFQEFTVFLIQLPHQVAYVCRIFFIEISKNLVKNLELVHLLEGSMQ